jgi:aryl-alcohol dehydrogenase-like predicted oxidoreductase
MRPLGKTGAKITLLELGTGRNSPFIPKAIRHAYARGVRTFDTAHAYGTEPAYKEWFAQNPEIRKEIFLVTKDGPKSPDQIPGMVDKRLEALGVDHIDLFMIHGLGDDHSLDDAIKMVTSKEFKTAADKVRKSGKSRFIGFSTHHKDRAAIIQAAADAGIVDAIMLMYSPWLEDDQPLNRALDACHKKGVGLISMKQVAGGFPKGAKTNTLDEIQKRVPTLKEKNLSPYQGLLHAIWTDERISGSCVSMRTTEQIRDNSDAARRYAPLKTTELKQIHDAFLAAGPTLCAGCDGRCSEAAGTKAELGNLTRFLTYHEFHGDRSKARAEYAKLSAEARDWSEADLEAARQACHSKLDFANLLPKVDKYLA